MCSFTLPTYAASDGTEDIIASDMQLTVYEQTLTTDDSIIDISSNCSTGIWNRQSHSQFNGFFYVTAQNSDIDCGKLQFILLSEDLKLTADHEYNLSFSYGVSNYRIATLFYVQLVYCNSAGEVIKESDLYSSSVESTDVVDVDFSFKLDSSDLSGGYNVKLKFGFMRTYNSPDLGFTHYFISDEIGFVDKDDDSGWFQKIINKIEETINNIKQIPEKINQKLTELKESISNAFVELKENLVEGIRGLFIPSDGFFEEKKAELELFLEEHFGILWTAPNIMLSTIEQLLTMSPENPSITMPAIQFTWEEELITLTEPMTVNFNAYIGEGSPLETFYKFYRTFVTIILIFLFIHYCLKKYHYIFGKDGEAVEQ